MERKTTAAGPSGSDRFSGHRATVGRSTRPQTRQDGRTYAFFRFYAVFRRFREQIRARRGRARDRGRKTRGRWQRHASGARALRATAPRWCLHRTPVAVRTPAADCRAGRAQVRQPFPASRSHCAAFFHNNNNNKHSRQARAGKRSRMRARARDTVANNNDNNRRQTAHTGVSVCGHRDFRRLTSRVPPRKTPTIVRLSWKKHDNDNDFWSRLTQTLQHC